MWQKANSLSCRRSNYLIVKPRISFHADHRMAFVHFSTFFLFSHKCMSNCLRLAFACQCDEWALPCTCNVSYIPLKSPACRLWARRPRCVLFGLNNASALCIVPSYVTTQSVCHALLRHWLARVSCTLISLFSMCGHWYDGLACVSFSLTSLVSGCLLPYYVTWQGNASDIIT